MKATESLTITRAQARRALLSHQGLWQPRSMRGWADVRAYFARVGSIQFDPVDVAGISPEISLCARVRGFRREHLDEWLYKRRELCDVWDKNACIAPVGDFPILSAHQARTDWGWRVRNGQTDLDTATAAVIARLREEGPLSTSAFQHDAVQREALEVLRAAGTVGIHHREGRRRFFDLNERLLPEPLRGHTKLSPQEELDWFTLRRIGAVGMQQNRRSDAQLGFSISTQERAAVFDRLEREGRLTRVQVEDVSSPLFLRPQDAAMLHAEDRPAKAALLGPLDNLLWDRRLIKTLFDFHYMWEVYTPQDKRVYGSYTLPVLYGDRFVGRMQLARKDGALIVESWWPEGKLRRTKAMRREVGTALKAHAVMLGMEYDDNWEM